MQLPVAASGSRGLGSEEWGIINVRLQISEYGIEKIQFTIRTPQSVFCFGKNCRPPPDGRMNKQCLMRGSIKDYSSM
jgi:hypothetical protein